MIYESKNLLRSDNIKIETGKNFSFPLHLHGSFEFITVIEGEMTVTVDGKTYSLTSEKGLIVFPDQPHELYTEKSSQHFLCIFSPELVRAYSKYCAARVPESNLFTVDEFYLKKLKGLSEKNSLTEIKGLLYSICGEFDSQAVYTERATENAELLQKIFDFVEKNFTGKCNLNALAESTSYNYVYLSRYFKERTGFTFTDYVNRYRINQACYLLQNSKKNILSIAYECGYDSPRSFNRNFFDITKTTPSNYRTDLYKQKNISKEDTEL